MINYCVNLCNAWAAQEIVHAKCLLSTDHLQCYMVNLEERYCGLVMLHDFCFTLTLFVTDEVVNHTHCSILQEIQCCYLLV